MIKATCDKCGKSYSLPDAAAGKKAKCKACDGVIAIPAADDDPLGLGGDSGTGATDLSALYGEASDGPAIGAPAATEAVGFNPSVSFSNAPRRSSSGPPLKLILGGIGALVALILIVGIVVVVFSGGGDDAEDPAAGPGLTAGSSGFVPTEISQLDDNDQAEPDREQKSTDPVVTKYPGSKRLVPGTSEAVEDWTLVQTQSVDRTRFQAIRLRGIEFLVPTSWEVSIPSEEFASQAQDLVERISFLLAFEREAGLGLSVMVSRPMEAKETIWPSVYQTPEMSHEMFGSLSLFDETDSSDEMSALAYGGMDPHTFFVHADRLLDIEYGVLFGGYPFIRVEVEPANIFLEEGDAPARSISYIGYVGELLVWARFDVQEQGEDYLDGLKAMLRVARLLDREQAIDAAENDLAYIQWAEAGDDGLVFADSPKPMPDLPLAARGGYDDLLGLARIGKGGLVHPVGQAFGFVIPDSLEVTSTTRTAVRTQHADDGFWVGMEVHKLSGMDRRQETPQTASGRLLVRGRQVEVMPDAELTEIESDHFTIQRLLYPADAGADVRRVAYVMKDGPYLITVMGRYPADDPARLEELDQTARSVQPIVLDAD